MMDVFPFCVRGEGEVCPKFGRYCLAQKKILATNCWIQFVARISGGSWRTRTAVNGFADRYLATRSRNLDVCGRKGNTILLSSKGFVDKLAEK